MTTEGDSYQNPIRGIAEGVRDSRYWDSQALLEVFNNQKPGIVVRESAAITPRTFKCTKYKKLTGEPIWAEIDNNNMIILGDYYIYTRYINSANPMYNYLLTLADTIETSTQTKKLLGSFNATQTALRQQIFNKKIVGNYFFIKLTNYEVSQIKGDGELGLFNNPTSSSAGDTNAIAHEALNRSPEMYRHMRTDSNGRTGYGTIKSRDMDQYLPSGGDGLNVNGFDFAKAEADEKKRRENIKNNNNTKGGNAKNGGGKSPITGRTAIKVINKKLQLFTNNPTALDLPYMKQTINHFSAKENSRQRIERTHVFEMIPNSFEFSQLSSAWNEVSRSGNYPLVDWSNYQLTKVSFSFLVVAKNLLTNSVYAGTGDNKRLESSTSVIVNDGLLVSIDEQLDNIRAMLGTPAPITLYNMNTLLSTEYRYPYTKNTRNMQWVINDASITATRLTSNGKAISAAEVSITLTEYPNIAREIIPLPPLTPDVKPPTTCKPNSGDPKCTPVDPTYGLWVENTYKYIVSETDSVSHPAGKP